MIKDDCTKWDNETLQLHIERVKESRRNIALHLAEVDAAIVEYQAELDRRAVAAYWQAHPDLLRLEVGDKVLMTEAKHKNLPFRVRGGIYAVGYTYDIINVQLKDGTLIVEFSMLGQGVYTNAYKQKATLEEAQSMRRAWLESEESP